LHHQGIREALHEQLFGRLTARRNRVTVDDAWMAEIREREFQAGILIGRW
jgi:hypothetical protein